MKIINLPNTDPRIPENVRMTISGSYIVYDKLRDFHNFLTQRLILTVKMHDIYFNIKNNP